MAWILKSDRHYTNGATATLYHKCFFLGLNECTTEPEEAKVFKTKKEAIDTAKMFGKSWEAVKT